MSDKYLDLDGVEELGGGASNPHELEAFTELLFWIDDNHKYIPYKDFVERGYASDGELDVDVFNILGSSIGKNSLFRAGNIKGSQKRNALINSWVSLVSSRAKSRDVKAFEHSEMSEGFLLDLVRMSPDENSICKLESILANKGIILVIEPSFAGLGIDGAVFLNDQGNPVIGHSVRFDRYDNFWFTILHELAHIVLHYDEIKGVIVEDFEEVGADDLEKEANYLAGNTIVPNSIWRRSLVIRKQTPKSVVELAEKLSVHPALIAGKFHFEKGNFAKFKEIVSGVSVKGILGI